MSDLLLLINPLAGQKRANKMLCDIGAVFQEYGFRTELHITTRREDAKVFTASEASNYDRIVCIGGDGTLNEVISGVIASGSDVPVGYIPAGSTNDYANTLGLSSDILTAARDAAGDRIVDLDVGSFNGRTFIYTASCGAFTSASYNTSQTMKNTLGHIAYIFGGLADLASMRPYHIAVECNGERFEEDYLFCSVTNSTSIGGILKLSSETVHLNDGVFEVILVRNPENPIDLSEIIRDLSTMALPSRMVRFFSAQRISFDMDDPVPWTLDGEWDKGAAHVELVNHHGAIRFILPSVRDNDPSNGVIED